MATLFIDTETRSAIDLRKSGASRYTRDPSTDCYCIPYAFDDEPAQVWWPDWTHAFVASAASAAGLPRGDISRVKDHVAAGGLCVIHNASFDLSVWEDVLRSEPGWPPMTAAQVRDTMVCAQAQALPASLEELAKLLNLPTQKDTEGGKVMKQIMKPRKTRKGENPDVLHWDETPERFVRVFQYALLDVDTMRHAYRRLRPLSDSEQKLWELDRVINQRGVYLDMRNVRKADTLVADEGTRLASELSLLTDGTVPSANARNKLLEWLQSGGLVCEGLRAHQVEALLTDNAGDLLFNVSGAKRALEIRKEAAKTSTSKLKAMLARVCNDNRARDNFQFHGARTGRWAGRGIQMQNPPRTPDWWGVADAENAFRLFHLGDAAAAVRLWYGSSLNAVSWSLRSLLMAAPGNKLMCADFANIEGRVLAWLAGEAWKLQAFRDFDTILGQDAAGELIRKGADLYKLAYARSFGIPVAEVTKDQRQIGKVQELALGFQGGPGAYAGMVATYKMDLDEVVAAVHGAVASDVWRSWCEKFEKAKSGPRPPTLSLDRWVATSIIVHGWRAAHPLTQRLWWDLESAAVAAVQEPGETFLVRDGLVRFRQIGDTLLCRLPSGRALSYPFPEVEAYTRRVFDGRAKKWEERAFWKVQHRGYGSRPGGARVWGTQYLYGGLLAENVTQAVARDVLADAMRAVESAGYPIVMHVHDEIVAEVPESFGSLTHFEHLMSQNAPWRDGLPVAVSGWEGLRYRK